MYTTCSKCKQIFMGEAAAFNMVSEPFCAGCFNEIAYGNPTEVKPSDIPLSDSPQMGMGLYPPPTMG